MRAFSRSYLAAFASSLLTLFAMCSVSSAQTYETEILIEGLKQPTGITVDLYGNLYYTTIPTPGVSGGDNQVVRYSLRNGSTFVVSTGEPEPVNLTTDLFGTVYWSCKTAGVILSSDLFGTQEPEFVFEGLNQPSGIAAFPIPGLLAFTEVPTPGVFEADNTVNYALQLGQNWFALPVSSDEPEPVDVAIGFDGTLYWTCKTAGVILKQELGEEKEVLLEGLAAPTGIDVDAFGRVYWTEVPTPGVFGTDGGTNKVLMYDPSNGATTLISEGEPEPVDVTVTPSGRAVYWTCRTAGVIIVATEVSDSDAAE